MKCELCNKRKGKRYCPAKRTEICPVCCGQKRGIEIDCPLDCKYFVEGQKNHNKKVNRERIKKDGVKSYMRKAELYSRAPGLFANIEIAISQLYRSNKEFTNRILISGLEQASKTLETESRGIIYEYMGENEYANEVARAVLSVARQFTGSPQGQGLNTNFVTQVFDEFIAEAKFYDDLDGDEDSYPRHLARYHPEEKKSVNDQSGLIIKP